MSVLFADLVGFTAASESRDAEDTRELLSRYFDTCRRLIELYGGTVEKFIGDAVMAVWGTPVATEDDAERAVRAALDLVAAVSALGDEVGVPELRARAGVLTGETAVTIGASGEGMVAGDLVNTASRVQSVAEPGTVFVGESTRRATEQTIVFAVAGSFELKGKEGQTPLWQALRVVSGARGTLKSTGLEAPFVGRDGELRRIKDLFHASADEGRAQLVSVTGVAGIGKSRLAWEFYKYFDGLPQFTYWHRGRCLAYGEGVAYWALADMVRMRCRIAEDEAHDSARAKLREALEEHLTDPEERAFVEPRLAQLLGLADGENPDRQDLFAAWRLFFERLAEVYPTVLAFEDMQWADASLLDFVEHLLDWSRNHPLYVITLARPELVERRPTWGAAQRNFTSIHLDPLPEQSMGELLDGLVPGLPAGMRGQILDRAEGVPLYAVETVRMLLDRGDLVQDGPVYTPTGEIVSLDVPETLHALIAARLDGLTPDERRLLQDGAVLGKTFTERGLAALGGVEGAEVGAILTRLVRKEVLSLQTDPRSPEHGQYGFLQDLVRHVAYETLSRRERRARHLAAAAYLDESLGDDEVAEVIAAHYVAAYEAAPDAEDALEIRAKASGALTRAGERARALAASAEEMRYLRRAAEPRRIRAAGACCSIAPGRQRSAPTLQPRRGSSSRAPMSSSPQTTRKPRRSSPHDSRSSTGSRVTLRVRRSAGTGARGALGPRVRGAARGGRGPARALPHPERRVRTRRVVRRTGARHRRAPRPARGGLACAQQQGRDFRQLRSAERGPHPARGSARDRARARPPCGRPPRVQQPRLGARDAGPAARGGRGVPAGRGICAPRRRPRDRAELPLREPPHPLRPGEWDEVLARAEGVVESAVIVQTQSSMLDVIYTILARGDIGSARAWFERLTAGLSPRILSRSPPLVRSRPSCCVPREQHARRSGSPSSHSPNAIGTPSRPSTRRWRPRRCSSARWSSASWRRPRRSWRLSTPCGLRS